MRVRQSLGLLLVLLLLAFVATACADRKEPTGTFYTAHPTQWMEQESVDFHGALVRRDSPVFCQSCHGQDLMGEDEAPSCYACHDGPGGHPENWINPDPPFHADQVALTGPQPCRDCHGDDYRGGWTGVSCYTCHNGPAGDPF